MSEIHGLLNLTPYFLRLPVSIESFDRSCAYPHSNSNAISARLQKGFDSNSATEGVPQS